MILKLIHEAQLSKDDRKKFIPFVNQRNHMGSIIKSKQKDKEHHKSIEVFQNLKKTSKEYFFDKKFQKMKQKLERCKLSLQQKQPNYDDQIISCFKALEQNPNLRQKDLNESSFEESNLFFVDLNKKLGENISTLKEQIQKNKKQKTEIIFRSIHNNLSRSKTSNYPPNSLTLLTSNKTSKQNFYQRNEDIRRKTLINSKQKDYFNEKNSVSPINRQIFKDVGPMSQTMADFTNYGLKYKYMVKPEKKDPWKKWYVNSKIQIFPGETVKVKKLQKSIYE